MMLPNIRLESLPNWNVENEEINSLRVPCAIVTNSIQFLIFHTPFFPSDSSGLESLQSLVLVLLSLQPLDRVQLTQMIVFTYRKTKEGRSAA